MDRVRFPRYAWGVVFYNIAVILWGAIVRATSSGDGCGNHWPLCNGAVSGHHTLNHLIEFAHRCSSGMCLILVLILLVWALRAYPAGHPTRLAAKLSVLCTLSEAALGAGLVLLNLVGTNDSVYRAVAISVHLTNTFLLLMALTMTTWLSAPGRSVRLRGQGIVGVLIAIAVAGVILVGITGAVTALGDTLFPNAGLDQDFAPTAHFLVRLRIIHPIIAVSVGLYLSVAAGVVSRLRPSAETGRYTLFILALFALQLFGGVLDFALRAPIWIQVMHLLIADLLWVSVVLLAAAGLTGQPSAAPREQGFAAPSPQAT